MRYIKTIIYIMDVSSSYSRVITLITQKVIQRTVKQGRSILQPFRWSSLSDTHFLSTNYE